MEKTSNQFLRRTVQTAGIALALMVILLGSASFAHAATMNFQFLNGVIQNGVDLGSSVSWATDANTCKKLYSWVSTAGTENTGSQQVAPSRNMVLQMNCYWSTLRTCVRATYDANAQQTTKYMYVYNSDPNWTGTVVSGDMQCSAEGAIPVTVGLTATPATVASGQSSTLVWTSSGATSCTGTNFNTTGATSGTVSVNPTVTKTYTVTCTNGTSGSSASQQVTVSSNPTVDLTANAATIVTGSTVTLTWESTGETQCTGTNFSTGGAVGGSTTVVVTANTTYIVTCTGGSSMVTDSVVVTTTAPNAPTCKGYPATVYVNESTIIVGGPNNGQTYAGTLIGWSDRPNVVVGTAGNDIITTYDYPDVVCALGGNNTVTTNGGSDIVITLSGIDTIRTGDGNDFIDAGTNNDTALYGGAGNDIVYAGAGNDKIYAESGDDTVYGNSGNDTLTGSSGNDALCGGSGDDTLYGNTGRDIVGGDTGKNKMQENTDGEVDHLYKSSSTDTVVAGAEDVTHTTQAPQCTNDLVSEYFIDLVASDTSIDSGEESVLTWTSFGYTTCTGTNFSTGGMTRGTTEVSPTSSKTYTLICTTAGVSGSDAVTVEVTSLAEPPVISIFTADPEVISAGEITTVTWESTEATQCTGAQFSTDGAVGGSQDVAPANTTTYQLSCSGPGGTVTDSVTVTVVPKPVASIAADPPVIQPGESSELTWTSSHADFCVGTGFSTGAGQTTSGSVIVSPTVTTTYLVTCTGELENDADSVEIIVGVPNISIEVLTDSFPFVPYNGVTDIRWESTDTQSCVLTGPGVSATGTSGETTSQPITGKTTFTLVCQTAFGPVSTSTTIFNPPRPHEI